MGKKKGKVSDAEVFSQDYAPVFLLRGGKKGGRQKKAGSKGRDGCRGKRKGPAEMSSRKRGGKGEERHRCVVKKGEKTWVTSATVLFQSPPSTLRGGKRGGEKRKRGKKKREEFHGANIKEGGGKKKERCRLTL